jgi:hypothetical protein
MNKLLLRKAQQSSDLAKLMVDVVNYTFGSSFFYRTQHLEGEEVFRSTKQPINCPPGANNDSHCHNHVNVSCPQVIVLVVQPNIVKNVGMQQLPCGSSVCLPLVFQSGLELKENIYVDGLWHIECSPPSFAIRCSMLHKTTRLK